MAFFFRQSGHQLVQARQLDFLKGSPMTDHFDEEEIPNVGDGWDEFRYEDQDPIGLSELASLELTRMPENLQVRVMDDYFPDATITRVGDKLVCHIEDHMYTKFWQHRYSAYAFAEAMERAVVRLIHEGHPFSNPKRDDEDVHISFVGI